jgi:hypothetical protein
MPRARQRFADSNDNVRLKNGITFSWKQPRHGSCVYRSRYRAARSRVLDVLTDEGERPRPGTTSGIVVLTWLKPTFDASMTMNAIVATRCAVIDFSKLSCGLVESLACMMCRESTGREAVGSSA